MLSNLKQTLLRSATIGFIVSATYAAFYDRIELFQLSMLILILYCAEILIFTIMVFITENSTKRKVLWFLLIGITSPFILKWIFYSNEPYFYLISTIQKCFPFSITINVIFFEYLLLTSPVATSNNESFEQTQCKYCGKTCPPHYVFCPHCFKLSPAIDTTLNTYKNKKPLDFTSVWFNQSFCCPHCGSHHKSSRMGLSVNFDSPIQCCKNCRFHFVDNTQYEWSVISLAAKLFGLAFRFISSFFFSFCFITTFIFPQGQNNLSLSLITSAIITPILTWILHRNEIKESKLRLDSNPEYPQLLKKMGYELLDDKYSSQERN